jgi:hypothetical protein
MTGVLEVLNAGLGDVKVTFEGKSPYEIANDILMIRDMMKQGYAIMVQLEDGSYKRVRSVNEKHQTYVIRTEKSEKAERKSKKAPTQVPVATTRATSVGRSAGGPAPRTPWELLASFQKSHAGRG